MKNNNPNPNPYPNPNPSPSPNPNPNHKDDLHNKSITSYWNRFIWHGGSTFDAWLNAGSAQVNFP